EMAPGALGKGVEVQLLEGEEIAIEGDPDLLRILMRNLIDNAIRYSPEKTRVGIGIRSKDGLVAVSVTDQGEGLSPEDQERVFERFYRVDAARSRHTGGTGLGLSIVKHVVANHGGEVTLWSKPGQGSTFTIRLPELEGQDDGVAEVRGPAARAAIPAAEHSPSQNPRPIRRDAAGAHEQGATA
uniref:sensor histidine kinase n=1 Tax=uncultured Arthrobacter sp. TaxID=114050 RepID=UPI00321789F2